MNPETVEFERRLRFPCSIIVAGVSGGGKTHWVYQLLREQQHMFTEPIDSCLLCYGIYQPLYGDMMEAIPNLSVSEGCNEKLLRHHGVLDPNKKTILVIDDLHSELANDPLLSQLFCKFSHHLNTTVIFLTQNLYRQGRQMRDVISNCHYLCFLSQPRDKTAVMCLARQMFPQRTKYFMQAYEEATERPFGYLLVDARPETSNELRLRSGVFPGDQNVAWIPI